MPILVYDHTALVEPNLLIPGKKPIGPVEFGEKRPPHLHSYFPLTKNPRNLANTNHGTLVNAPEFVIRNGYRCILFNGINNYVSFPSDTSLPFTLSPFTVSFWICPTVATGTGGYMRVFSYDELTFWWQHGNSDFQLSLSWYNGGWVKVRLTSTPPTNQWSHIAFTYNAANAVIYYNGREEADGGAMVPPTSTVYKLAIGSKRGGAGYYSGAVRDFEIHSRALSATEIQQIYYDPYQTLVPA